MIEFFKYKRKTLSYPDLAVVVKRVFPESKVTPRGEGEKEFLLIALDKTTGAAVKIDHSKKAVLVQPITPKRSFIDSYLGANQEPDEGFAKAIFRILKKEITT